jgi:hypothetical protein
LISGGLPDGGIQWRRIAGLVDEQLVYAALAAIDQALVAVPRKGRPLETDGRLAGGSDEP